MAVIRFRDGTVLTHSAFQRETIDNTVYLSEETMRNDLEHSSGPWKDHKYVRKDGDRYVYSNSDLERRKSRRKKKAGKELVDKVSDAIDGIKAKTDPSRKISDELLKEKVLRKDRKRDLDSIRRTSETLKGKKLDYSEALKILRKSIEDEENYRKEKEDKEKVKKFFENASNKIKKKIKK